MKFSRSNFKMQRFESRRPPSLTHTVARVGTPSPILDRITQLTRAALAEDEAQQSLITSGFEPTVAHRPYPRSYRRQVELLGEAGSSALTDLNADLANHLTTSTLGSKGGIICLKTN